MEYQKFIPEGWNETPPHFDWEQLQTAKLQGSVMQGFVEKCDANYNLQIHLGNGRTGTIPKSEIDALEEGIRPSICKNKVNQVVQFKVKSIENENQLILSRKEVEKDAWEWAKNELEQGSVVNRNRKKY